MKKMALMLVLLAGVPMALSAEVTKEDLKKLASAGISDGVILSYVKSNGPVAKLSAEDLVELKQAGASDTLLAAVLSDPGPASRPSPVHVAPSYSEAALPSTTYVYNTTPSYSPSVYYDDFYPSSYYYSGYSGYCAPSLSVGLGYYGSRYCDGYYGSRSFNGYSNGSRVIGNCSSYSGYNGARVVGGHSGFSGSGHSGFGGGGHASGGGHGGHR
jgi:hypothetical protein